MTFPDNKEFGFFQIYLMFASFQTMEAQIEANQAKSGSHEENIPTFGSFSETTPPQHLSSVVSP